MGKLRKFASVQGVQKALPVVPMVPKTKKPSNKAKLASPEKATFGQNRPKLASRIGKERCRKRPKLIPYPDSNTGCGRIHSRKPFERFRDARNKSVY